MSIIVIVCGGIIVVVWLYIFASGLWKYLFGGKKSVKEREREEKLTRAERIQKRLEAKEKAKRTTSLSLEITKSAGREGGLEDHLLERPKLLRRIAKYTILTKDDFEVSKEWINAALTFGFLKPIHIQGLYEVQRETIGEFRGAKPSYGEFAPEFVTLPDDLKEEMHKKGIKTIGMLAFRRTGPVLGYTIGYSKQAEFLSDPSTAGKAATGLSTMGETIGILDSENLKIVAAEKEREGKTHYVYAEPIREVVPEVKRVVERVCESFNGVDRKHSFKLAVVKALGGEPSDELKEKVAEEEKEEVEEAREGEETAEIPLPEEELAVLEEGGVAAPAAEEIPSQTEDEEEAETEEVIPYRGFRDALAWLKRRSEERVTTQDLERHIYETVERVNSMGTAKEYRRRLRRKGYTEEIRTGAHTYEVKLTEKGKQRVGSLEEGE